MFELSIALKYLIPRKRHLSVTLIALMSTAVISIVVWLLLVFLSVTEGMEKAWLKKLTALNAPLRITPTPAYFSSYYYKIDSLSSAENFSPKTLGEKLEAPLTTSYDPEEDPELPTYFPKAHLTPSGDLLDPVKELARSLNALKQEEPSLLFQDYEMSGATLKLQLLRSANPFASGQESLSFLTQVSYLATPPSDPSILNPLLIPPNAKELNHLLFLAGYRMEGLLRAEKPDVLLDQRAFEQKVRKLLSNVEVTSVTTSCPHFRLPASLLPIEESFSVHGFFEEGQLTELLLPSDPAKPHKHALKGTFKDGVATFAGKSHPWQRPLLLEMPLTLHAKVRPFKEIALLEQITLEVSGTLQGKKIKGILPWKDLFIESFTLKSTPSELFVEGEETGILLPKSFQENGVLLGDKGFISYSSSTASSLQEQRSAVFVAGFYDPGIFSIGNKCLLVPRKITRTINAANTSFIFDKIALNGFQVWVDDPNKALALKAKIEASLEEKDLSRYFQVTSFQEYDFAKDLLQQFQSDKYLFSLIGLLILLVACCNIFSFLILLVSDKKKEIAILEVMGASKKSIALIFGLTGTFIGLLGSAIGIFAALCTLHNIDAVVGLLSQLQGHEAFHQSFYGSSLPNVLSGRALLFIAIATPLLSLLAGLIPALKACRLNPSTLLRSES